FGIGNDAHDLEFVFVLGIQYVFAQNGVVREELALECLIDDTDPGSVRGVLRGETTSAEQRDLDRREIVFANHLPVGDVLSAALFRFSRQENSGVVPVVRNKRDAPKGGRAHARQVVQTFKELLVELNQPLAFVSTLL